MTEDQVKIDNPLKCGIHIFFFSHYLFDFFHDIKKSFVIFTDPCLRYHIHDNYFSESLKNIKTRLLYPPVNTIVVRETKTDFCQNPVDCSLLIKAIINRHLKAGIYDKTANFYIDENHNVYTGLGWKVFSDYKRLTNKMLLVSFIGNYAEKTLDISIIETVRKLIDCGVKQNFVDENYKINGLKDAINEQVNNPSSSLANALENLSEYSNLK